MKKVLIIILLISTTITAYAFDFSAVCSTGQTLYYNILTDSTVGVTYPNYYWRYSEYYYGYSKPVGDLVIPNSILHDNVNYQVVSIENNAFYNCTGIHSLVIPDSVTSIGESAFYGCSGIDSLYLGSSLTTIPVMLSTAAQESTALSFPTA